MLAIISGSNENKRGTGGPPVYDGNGRFLKEPKYWKPEPKINALLRAAIWGTKT